MVEKPETQRLCVTKAATGVVEAEEEEVLLDAKMKPETIGDQGAVDFHNCGGWHDQQIFWTRQDTSGRHTAPGLLGPFVGVDVKYWSRQQGTGNGLSGRMGRAVTFFSLKPGDSGSKLMLLSSPWTWSNQPSAC